MCGIIGVYLKRITAEQIQQIAKLILQSGIRGIHATGISYVKNNEIHTISEHKSSSKFLIDKKIEDYTDNGNLHLIGHTRYSTSDLKYNQPIGDNNMTISHNGVISQENPELWNNIYNLETKTTNDSELIFASLKANKDPLTLGGSMAVCVLSNNKLIAFRNHERPLWRCELPNGIVFASTKDILMRSGFDKPKKCDMFTKYEYEDKLNIIKQKSNDIEDLQNG